MANLKQALGSEIREFYQNNWPEGYYHDDCPVEFYNQKDEWQLAPDAQYKLDELGYLMPENGDDRKMLTFQEAFSKWAKQRDYEVIVVRVPKAARATVEEFVATLPGAKII